MEQSVYRLWVQMLSWKLSCPPRGPMVLLNPTRQMLNSIFHKTLYHPMLPNTEAEKSLLNTVQTK
jgi:hypothetical protein